MEIGSTSISELPIQTNNPNVNIEEQIENSGISTEKIVMDDHATNQYIASPVKDKKVTFENEPNPSDTSKKQNETFIMKIEHKIIVLATFLFFVFFDRKFQKYILNILVQVFGDFLKTEHGNMTKIGLFFYSIFFGSLLSLIVTFVDLSSFHLAF